MNTSLIAGILSGIAGLLVFLTIHHFWIMPIWFILPFGLVIAAIGGAAVGWAYGELLPHLPPRPWTVLAMVALICVILLPSVVLAELRRPVFDISGEEAILAVSIGRVPLIFILELLVASTVMGALLGWLIGRTNQAALATAVAGFIFALGPGHNIPLIGGTPGVSKELMIMTAVIVVSATVLVVVHAWLFEPGLVAQATQN